MPMSCLNRVLSQSAITRGMRIHLGSIATRPQAFFRRTIFQIQFQIDRQLTMAAASYCAQTSLGSCAEALTLCGIGLTALDESMPMHRFERSTARTFKGSAVSLPCLDVAQCLCGSMRRRGCSLILRGHAPRLECDAQVIEMLRHLALVMRGTAASTWLLAELP